MQEKIVEEAVRKKKKQEIREVDDERIYKLYKGELLANFILYVCSFRMEVRERELGGGAYGMLTRKGLVIV